MTTRGDVANVVVYAGLSANTAAGVTEAQAWLEAANAVVTARLGASGLADTTLARIEEHLAAHYVELGAGRQIASERLPDYAVSYAGAGKSLDSLQATRNGRIAQELDTTGALVELSKPKPSFVVL